MILGGTDYSYMWRKWRFQHCPGDEKLTADSIPYLVPTQFQESIPPPHNPTETIGSGYVAKNQFQELRRNHVWNWAGHVLYNVYCWSRNPWQKAATLFAYWKCVGQGASFPTHNIWRRQFSPEIFKSFTWNRCLQKSIPQRNWLLTRNQFRGLMPGVLKSLKNQTLKLSLAEHLVWEILEEIQTTC